ncbi:signal transduction histidine kinase [Mitsuaria sp. BK045]|uniref:sensor histidine kinase n=1 Tax=unclassified Roseateles TaxID=2626991 RepID=UPI00161984D7|nr:MULTISPECIES: ATP-binding protein [unclassified Roseateles]MBB3294416.1 signal transduction histidine kinase [Mitsuaria sp. BK041]MBB3363632.1 signal transduction histidine kinase [Mitsuaria sp. BK045]
MREPDPPRRARWHRSLRLRLALCLIAAAVAALSIHLTLTWWPVPRLMAALGREALAPWSATALALTGALMLPIAWGLASLLLMPLTRLLRALESTVLSYRDGEFGSAIAADPPGGLSELSSLMRLHSELGQALREQRQHLAQRELLLDTVVQNTPVALVLTDARERIAYANIAARQLMDRGRGLAGRDLDEVLSQAPDDLRQAFAGTQDGLFSVVLDGEEERFHLSLRDFRLQGQPHRLRLLRGMTRELSRQEVASWKRVIRVISHELNNSLAPISSLAHSGAELARRGMHERVPGVFASIGDRAQHLHQFLAGYASFAKLPAPVLTPVEWAPFIESLSAHYPFTLGSELPAAPGRFDAAQMAQALINLLKNAHESGSAPQGVSLSVGAPREDWRIEVGDRGPGMTETQLSQALLPFYSTKRSGSGLGLALAREIAEAHGGRIAMGNREGGGLWVAISWPRS